MNEPPAKDHRPTPAELKERLAAERTGKPLLVYRDDQDRQRIVTPGDLLTIGRGGGCDLRLAWDPKVSRLHAELRRSGGEWLLVDAGSRNGTLLNGVVVAGQARVRPGDVIEIGATEIVFRAPAALEDISTAAAATSRKVEVSPAQRRVLVALCEEEEASGAASPPTNREIAEQLHLSLPAVKTHLHKLFQRFGIDDLPQNEKRARLARLARETGTVSLSDFRR